MNKRVSAVVLLTLVMLIWGSSYAVTKASLVKVSPMLLAFLRNFIASVLLLAFAQMRGGTTHLPRPFSWATIALMGLTGVCLYYIGFNMSLFYTSASQGALIETFAPIATTLLAAVFLKESLSAKLLLGVGISTTGVILIISVAAPEANAPKPLFGNALMLCAIIAWATYTILAKRLAECDQIVVTAYSTAFGTLLLVPFALYELSDQSFPTISASGWLSILYLGMAASAVAYWLYNRSLKQLAASQTAQFLNLLPVIGVAGGVLLLDERVLLQQIFGGALVLSGVWLSLQKRRT